MATECIPGCGRCCDPVITSFDPREKKEGPSAEFIQAHWKVIDILDEATSGTPFWRSACDQFDRETRLCTAHEERPPICSGYPWYDGNRSRTKDHPLDPGCAFNADIDKLLLPLFVVGEGA
jgi:Fe-S-cluster containining protein